jgi:hypothetical protein
MNGYLVFYTTFSNISAISWRPVLEVEEAGVDTYMDYLIVLYDIMHYTKKGGSGSSTYFNPP